MYIHPLTESQPSFQQILTSYDPERRALWYWMAAKRPCFTLELLNELRTFQDFVAERVARAAADANPIEYLVGASVTPGIFNLGGDLAYFISLINARDHARLNAYARASVEILFFNATHRKLPITTISLIQGSALGGGFEAALSSNVVVAERQSKMGFPEVLFNMLPGMGAYSLLARRVDLATTERVMMSGLNYGAAELHGLGLVDVLAEAGEGERAVGQYMAFQARRDNARNLLSQIRDRVSPLSLDELYDIADMWTDAALRISARDLRVMERLVSMQQTLPAESHAGTHAAIGKSVLAFPLSRIVSKEPERVSASYAGHS